MASSSPYSALPQDTGKYYIRLLELHSGQDGDPVSCGLRTLDLAAPGPHLWDALSYVWGQRSPEYSIGLGGRQITIRQNLYEFLIELRKPDEDILLWVDSLCIDQSSLDERASQVSFMDKIYKGARRVLTWLGPADDDGSLATDLIHQVAVTPSSIVSPSDHQALLAWATRPYWRRSWIVQEFLLAKDVSLFSGHKRTTWSVLAQFVQHFFRGLDLEPAWASFIGSPAYKLMRQRALGGRVEAPLSQLLIENQETECEHPHDKVYSLIGLATKSEHGRTIQPSYTKELTYLVIDVLHHCEIPSKDLIRFVSFLLALLRITPGSLSFSMMFDGLLRSFKPTGFLVGTIVHANTINTRARSAYELHRHDHHYKTKLRDYSAADVSRMLNDLDDLDFKRLHLARKATSTALEEIEPVETVSLVLVLISNCERTQILVGLAAGLVRYNHQVVYFLGHDIGMVLKRQANNGLEHSRSVGTVLCANADRTARPDVLTRQRSKYWSVQNEGDLIAADSRIQLEMTPFDVLRAAQ